MKKTVFIMTVLGIVLLCLFSGCGKSLFAPFTTSGVLTNPELALERADYLYLGGNVDEADEIYAALMEEYADDEEYQDVYFGAVRGHSKCSLEIDPDNSSDALMAFINFAMSVDTETFSLDEEGQGYQDDFEEHAAAFKEAVWESFTILTLIPMEHRTEADFGNMSISGLFTVCVDFLTLMTTTIGTTANLMQKLEEMETQIDEFTTRWDEELAIDPNPLTWLPAVQAEMNVLAQGIDDIYQEISTALTTTIDTMTDLKNEGEQVTTETAEATNALTILLNGVFDAVLEVVAGTLPPLLEMQNTAGEFYDNLNLALGW